MKFSECPNIIFVAAQEKLTSVVNGDKQYLSVDTILLSLGGQIR